MIAIAPLAPPRTEVEHSDTIMVDQPTVASHQAPGTQALGTQARGTQARGTHLVVRPLSGETDKPGGRSTHSERGQIKIEDRLLFESAIAVLLPDRHDLAHDFHVKAVALGLAVDFLDVARERFFFLFKSFDPLNERLQMTGVDLARTDGIRIRRLRHVHS